MSEQHEQTIAETFTSMAEEIERNAANPFGGAFVLAPPGDGVKPQIALFLGNACEASMFWGTVKALVEREIAMLDDVARQANMFGNMR